MRQWIPVSTSPKGRLVLAAVAAFGARAFDEVTVGDLAAAADVTTGAIYHHFGSKLALYEFVRSDVEQRLIDRLEGAVAARAAGDRTAAVRSALLVGFDFATRERFFHLLGAPPVVAEHDRLAEWLSATTAPAPAALGRVIAATWRAALHEVATGTEPREARSALSALSWSTETA